MSKFSYRVSPFFKKQFEKKTPAMQAAIAECIDRLAENPRHPSLQTHPVRGCPGVFEAYVDKGNRLTFSYDDSVIVLRNHCNHDILTRRP